MNYHPDSVPSLINSHFKIVYIDFAQTIKTLVWKWAADRKINQYSLQKFSCIKELEYQELLNQCASASSIYSLHSLFIPPFSCLYIPKLCVQSVFLSFMQLLNLYHLLWSYFVLPYFQNFSSYFIWYYKFNQHLYKLVNHLDFIIGF